MANRRLTSDSGWNALMYTLAYWNPKAIKNTRRAIRAVQALQRANR